MLTFPTQRSGNRGLFAEANRFYSEAGGVGFARRRRPLPGSRAWEVSEIQAPLPNSGLFKKSTRDFRPAAARPGRLPLASFASLSLRPTVRRPPDLEANFLLRRIGTGRSGTSEQSRRLPLRLQTGSETVRRPSCPQPRLSGLPCF